MREIDLYISQQLRYYRQHSGLSQRQLAQALGVTYQQVQKYEAGTNRLSAGGLFIAARALKINLVNLFPKVQVDSTN